MIFIIAAKYYDASAYTVCRDLSSFGSAQVAINVV